MVQDSRFAFFGIGSARRIRLGETQQPGQFVRLHVQPASRWIERGTGSVCSAQKLRLKLAFAGGCAFVVGWIHLLQVLAPTDFLKLPSRV